MTGGEGGVETKGRILLVDDERNALLSLARILRRKGFHVDTEESAEGALARIPAGGPRARTRPCYDVVVADLKMPGMDGMTLLKELKRRCARLPVVILTGYGTIRSAVEAMQGGAFEYLVKPSGPEEILAVLEKALRRARAAGGEAGQEDRPERRLPDLVGRSEAMTSLLLLVDRVASLPFTVLILGESGAGKELLARTIHERGAAADAPFVAVNCATVTPTLVESLFFGHRKGSFTGADSDRIGYFQAAEGGTLFLDEVADFAENVQGVLLRALQEGAVVPVGATRPVPVKLRVVAATNRDLEGEVRGGRFRADLFYRLNVVQLRVPPLRERIEDLRPLVDSILEEYRRALGFGPTRASEEVMMRLLAHSWPGNVRELRNVLERALAVVDGDVIEIQNLPSYLQALRPAQRSLSALEAVELRQIQAALSATGGEKKAAAELLGIDRKRLYRKLRRLGLYG